MAAMLGIGAGLVALLTAEAACLLVPIVVVSLNAGRGPAVLSVGLAVLVFASLLFTDALLATGPVRDVLRMAVFVATAALIARLLSGLQPVNRGLHLEHEARLIVDNMPGLGWSTDAKGNFRYLNPSIFDYTGVRCDPADRVSFAGAIVLHPDEEAAVVERWRHCLASGEPYESEHRLRRHDGAYRWFRAVARPSRDPKGRITGWYGVTFDIDDRRTAEDALRRSERELSSIVESIPGMIAAADAKGEHVYANRRLLDYLGYDAADLPDYPWNDNVHPEDLKAYLELRNGALASGEAQEFTYRRKRWDGVYRWLRARAEPARDEKGNITVWYSTLVDVHEEKLAEQALRESEQRLRLLIDTIPALVWCADASGNAFYLNKRLLDYSGLSAEEASQARSRLIHPDDVPLLVRTWADCLANGQTFRIVYRLRRADGVYRWHEGRSEPWRDAAGGIAQWYGVNVDIDDRLCAEQALRTMQARFQRASQLAGLAELAASIAHEVNQPLAAVVTNSHACRRWLAAEPPNLARATMAAERIIRDANAAADVVSRVRALFKQTAPNMAPVDLNEVIGEVCGLLADDIAARKVRIELGLGKGLPPVPADRVQLQQVLVNLIRNGMEAMDGLAGPKVLTIATRSEEGAAVALEVRDHGSGIADPNGIFEPFFTTKAQGMGMGLAISRSIVEAHGGRIAAAHADPAGTVFTVVLPTEGASVAAEAAA
ncbi:MAG: PAS domain S-box protein [Alphaproteobacteria bacterium]|nr:PAS domain S-box protein [Alphaproteobacteria bacterium]MBV8410327.1 PAS domain S-box protein [Alphaproteobacteria bacterium]